MRPGERTRWEIEESMGRKVDLPKVKMPVYTRLFSQVGPISPDGNCLSWQELRAWDSEGAHSKHELNALFNMSRAYAGGMRDCEAGRPLIRENKTLGDIIAEKKKAAMSND